MKNLIEKGLINKYTLFLDNYKNIKISDTESIILLHILKLQENPNYKFTIEDFEQYTSLKRKKIEDSLASLTKKNIIKVNFKKGWIIDTSNVWLKIVNYIKDKNEKEDIDGVIEQVEKIITKPLRVTEIRFLKKIIDKGHYEQIEDIVNKISKEKQIVDFGTIEETITINIDKLKNIDSDILDYNWLVDK